MATLQEIRDNDYNLNIPRYVDTFEEEELIDIDQIQKNIADIDAGEHPENPDETLAGWVQAYHKSTGQ